MNNRILPTTLITLMGLVLFSLSACRGGTDEDIPVYSATPSRLQQGSLYYAQAGCHSCHGIAWDGKSDEAAVLKQQKLTATNFKMMQDPAKTPTAYFKAITNSTPALIKAGRKHSYQQHTDRARWAMANFLFSLAPRLKGAGAEKRNGALTKGLLEARTAYEKANALGRRRWEMYTGLKSNRDRESAPSLDTLLKKAGGVVEERARNTASSAGIRRERAMDGAGARLYRNNCAGCHGVLAQGGAVSGLRFGIINCDKNVAPRKPGTIDRKVRAQCAVFSDSRDLKRTGPGAFATAHQLNQNGLYPGFHSLSSENLQHIFSYIYSLIKPPGSTGAPKPKPKPKTKVNTSKKTEH